MSDVTKQDLKDMKEDLKEDLKLFLQPMMDKINDHHSTLYGNGRPGLKADLEAIRGDVRDIQMGVRIVKWVLGTSWFAAIATWFRTHS